MFNSLFKRVLLLLFFCIITFTIFFILVTRNYIFHQFSSHITRILYIEINNLREEMEPSAVFMELSYNPVYIFDRNQTRIWGPKEYYPFIPMNYYNQAAAEGYATFFSPVRSRATADYSIIWHPGHERFYIFQIPGFAHGYIDIFITPLFLFWGLLFILIAGLTWYIVYERTFGREMQNLRASLQYLSTGLYHEPLPRMQSKEFQRCIKDIHSLQNHISDLIGKYQYHQKAAFLGEINAKLSHQVRNSLHSIKSALALVEKKVSDKDSASLLDKVQEEVCALQYQAENLLSHIRPFKVNKVKKDFSSWITHWIQRHADDIEVSFEGPDKPLFIYFDQTAMQQVLQNLFQNARETRTKGLKVNVIVQSIMSGAVLKIFDNGPGFQQEILDTLTPKTTKDKGSGLGIFICRKIIEAHNGSLTIRNHVTGGAEIHIFLPHENTSSE